MPRSCSVCGHAATAAISKALLAGDSIRAVASRFACTPAATGRHLRGCLRTNRREKNEGDPRTPGEVADSSRFDSDGRCRSCGQLGPEVDSRQLDAPAILRKAEALLARSSRVADQAETDGNWQMVLAAVDRCQRGLDMLAKAAGLLQPDNSTTIIDARRQQVALLANLSVDELRSIAAAGRPIAALEAADSAVGHAHDN